MNRETVWPGPCEICGCPRTAKWLFVTNVAETLGVPPRTVRRWCQNGWVYARRAGKQWQIDHDDLDNYLQANQVGRLRNSKS